MQQSRVKPLRLLCFHILATEGSRGVSRSKPAANKASFYLRFNDWLLPIPGLFELVALVF